MNYQEMCQQIEEQNQLALNWMLVAVVSLCVLLFWQIGNAVVQYNKIK